MAETSIEWVKNPDGTQGRTWNPIRGCTRVSPGCGGPGPHGGCYAEGIAARFSGPGQPFEGIAEMRGGKGRWTGKLAFVEAKLTEPLRVRKPTTWFVNSMSDLFHEAVPDAWIDRVFAVMALCPQHTFQVLTKRSARMRAYLTAPSFGMRIGGELMRAARGHAGAEAHVIGLTHRLTVQCLPLPNCWLGVSTEDQRRADERIPDLLATPAAVRFVSAEPLLSAIDFMRIACPERVPSARLLQPVLPRRQSSDRHVRRSRDRRPPPDHRWRRERPQRQAPASGMVAIDPCPVHSRRCRLPVQTARRLSSGRADP